MKLNYKTFELDSRMLVGIIMVLMLTKINSGLAPSIEARHSIYVSSVENTEIEFSELNRANKEHPVKQANPANQLDFIEHPTNQLDSVEHPANQLDSLEHPANQLDSVEHPANQLDSVEHPVNQPDPGNQLDSVKHPVNQPEPMNQPDPGNQPDSVNQPDPANQTDQANQMDQKHLDLWEPCVLYNTTYTGAYLVPEASDTDIWHNCALYCSNASLCLGWRWNNTEKLCWVFTHPIGTLTVESDVDLAQKSCIVQNLLNECRQNQTCPSGQTCETNAKLDGVRCKKSPDKPGPESALLPGPKTADLTGPPPAY